MPVDTKHPAYNIFENDWIDCRTAQRGQRAVKAAGVRYLPRLAGQTDSEYGAYKTRALFYSITSKTLSALTGMALDQPPSITFPDEMRSYFEDNSGLQFFEVMAQAISENLLMGRFGALVDRPLGGGKPYVSLYQTEDILNWEEDEDGRLLWVVLRETYVERSTSDKFSQDIKTRYRHLYLSDGRVRVDVYISKDQGRSYNISHTVPMLNYGIPMTEIPFFCVTPEGLSINPCKPPMQDIVDINYSHYRTSADLEHGRHFTGLPTPWITGAESQTKMRIGSTSAWVIPDEKAKVGFLEFTGQGLQSLEKALNEKQAQLASLSARLIDNTTRGSEAAETVKLRYLSETSSLRAISRSVEAFLNQVYMCVRDMERIDGDLNIKLNTDFLDAKMSAAELKAWVDAYLQRGISKEIFIHALKTGKVLPPPGEDMGTIPDPPAPEPTNPNPKTSQE